MPTSSSAALLLLVATPVAAFTAPGMLTMRQKTAAPLSPRAVDPSMEMSLFTEIFEGTVNAIPILLPAAVVSVIGLDLIGGDNIDKVLEGRFDELKIPVLLGPAVFIIVWFTALSYVLFVPR